VRNQLVPQNIWRYRRGVAQTDVVITGFDCNSKLFHKTLNCCVLFYGGFSMLVVKWTPNERVCKEMIVAQSRLEKCDSGKQGKSSQNSYRPGWDMKRTPSRQKPRALLLHRIVHLVLLLYLWNSSTSDIPNWLLLKSVVFWDVTPRPLVGMKQTFRRRLPPPSSGFLVAGGSRFHWKYLSRHTAAVCLPPHTEDIKSEQRAAVIFWQGVPHPIWTVRFDMLWILAVLIDRVEEVDQ
jgi:hypothetical protein